MRSGLRARFLTYRNYWLPLRDFVVAMFSLQQLICPWPTHRSAAVETRITKSPGRTEHESVERTRRASYRALLVPSLGRVIDPLNP